MTTQREEHDMRIDITPEQAKLLRDIQIYLGTTDATTTEEDDQLAQIIRQIDSLTPNKGERRVTYKCLHCQKQGDEGSIYWDASTYWDEETQRFEASDDPNGDSFCGECGGERTATPYDIDTGEELRENIYGLTPRVQFVTLPEHNAARDAYHARFQAERDNRAMESKATEIANLLAADQERAQ